MSIPVTLGLQLHNYLQIQFLALFMIHLADYSLLVSGDEELL